MAQMVMILDDPLTSLRLYSACGMVNSINGVINVSLQCMFVFCAVLLHTLLCSGPCVCIFYIYRRLSALAVVACFFNLLLLCSIICNGGMRKSFSVFHVMHIYTCTATVKKIIMAWWECSNFLQHKWAVPLNTTFSFGLVCSKDAMGKHILTGYKSVHSFCLCFI